MFKACKTPLYMWIRHKPLSLPRKFLGFAPLKCMPKWNGGFRLWRCVRACKTNKFGLIQLLRRTYEASYSEKTHVIVVVFRLSPCLECSLYSFGNFPGVWSIKAAYLLFYILPSFFFTFYSWSPRTMEPTLSSETSAFILQTLGKFPKEHRLDVLCLLCGTNWFFQYHVDQS